MKQQTQVVKFYDSYNKKEYTWEESNAYAVDRFVEHLLRKPQRYSIINRSFK